MKNDILLPRMFKYPGYCIFLFLLYLSRYIGFDMSASNQIKQPNSMVHTDITTNILLFILLLGLVLVAFSKEKSEDEFIKQLRLNSLKWAFYLGVMYLALMIVLLQGPLFFFSLVLSPFVIIFFFIAHFKTAIILNTIRLT